MTGGLHRGNLFAGVPAALPDELVEVLASSPTARVERIVSRGHATAEGEWYDQEEDELVVVVDGAAELSLEGDDEPIGLTRGDWAVLPAHRRHRVGWTDPERDTVWLTVFLRR